MPGERVPDHRTTCEDGRPAVTLWVAVLCAAGAGALVLPARVRLPPEPSTARSGPPVVEWWLRRHRWFWSASAGTGVAVLVGGFPGVVAGVVGTVVAWLVIGHAEPPATRRRDEQVRRDLPHLVDLLASTLRAGAAPGEAVATVCAALPGPAADRLAGVAARLAMGVDPITVWEVLTSDPALAPLGRTLARSQATGAPVIPAVERLADDLERAALGEVEDRARAVGVRAAVPLGLCLLPAFLLIGIVPLVASLIGALVL